MFNRTKRLAHAVARLIAGVQILHIQHEELRRGHNQHADALEKLALHLGLTWDDKAQDWTADGPMTLEQIERAALSD